RTALARARRSARCRRWCSGPRRSIVRRRHRANSPGGAVMNFDIFLAPAADSRKVVKRAEELGFRRAWFYDTQLLNSELFASMAAAAMQTTTIRLGTGVLIPSNRIAPVAASGLPTLN